jgi:hypothetical protein
MKRMRLALSSVLNWLNAWGSILLAYALQNQTVVNELLPFLPANVRPFAPLLAGLWFATVQIAKVKAIKKAEAKPVE